MNYKLVSYIVQISKNNSLNLYKWERFRFYFFLLKNLTIALFLKCPVRIECEWKIIQTNTGDKVAKPCTRVSDPGPDSAWIRFQFRPSKPWIRIGIQPKMLDPDSYPYQMNKDPKPCLVL